MASIASVISSGSPPSRQGAGAPESVGRGSDLSGTDQVELRALGDLAGVVLQGRDNLARTPDALTTARERLAALLPYARGRHADEIFWDAMDEALRHHQYGNLAFRRLLSTWETRPVRGDVESLPFVHVNVFKTRLLLSVPLHDMVLHLTSSGTTGQTSQNPLDLLSKTWHETMLQRLDVDQGLVDAVPADVLWLMHDPAEQPNLAAVYSFTRLAGLTPVRDRLNAVQGGILRVDEALSWLASRSGQETRLRVIGACPFILKLLEVHAARGGSPFSFHPDSFVLTGGGWKAAQADAVPRSTFITRISEGLGIPSPHLRDHFGMVEHAVIYPECEHHRHHIPAYARVLIRHPGTLEVLPAGEPGLLQVITPMVHSIPAVSILTTDWAELQAGDCVCKRPAPTFNILRRAGISKNRGCAIGAAELLERVR